MSCRLNPSSSVKLLTVITLVMGRVDYCNSLLFNIPANTYWNILLQNCAAQLVWRTPVAPFYICNLIKIKKGHDITCVRSTNCCQRRHW